MDDFLLGFFPITAAGVTTENTSWVEVMITGEKMKNGGKTFTITRDDLDTYAADIKDRGGQKRIPLDYDHSYAEGGSTLASGWFTGQADIRDTDGKPSLWAEVQWTQKAADAIRSGEYAYISPEFSFQNRTKDGVLEKARQLLAATLTNRPFFDRMAPVQLASRRNDGGYEPSTTTRPEGAEEIPMTDTIAATVRKNLGLPEDADDAAVTAAIAAKDEQITKLEADKVELAKRPDVGDDQMKSLIASAAKGEQAAKDLNDIKRDAVLTAAVSSGKILPVQKDGYATMYDLDPENVVKLLAATPEKSFKAIGTGGDIEDAPVVTLKGVHEDETVEGADEAALVQANLAERNIVPAKATIDEYLESVAIVRAKAAPAS